MNSLKKIKECIDDKVNFVLQGGAGSGKTESLKRVIEYVSELNPDAKIACITHTNLAVDEIISRVSDIHTISTIHSFLNSLISNFKKNIHEVLFEIFILQKVERQDLSFYDDDEKLQKKTEHDNYKKLYSKYAKKLFILRNESIGKVVGKVAYDQDPTTFNTELNNNIDNLNCEILKNVFQQDSSQIKYNETRFDSLREPSFGHDSLLIISSLLFNRYPMMGKILTDKYDYIFIDEYQDTRKDVIDIFLSLLPEKSETVIGLFGDSMQGIYDDGIGDVNEYIEKGILVKIEKEDNYRCSDQVVKFINNFRNDNLVQQVAFKTINGHTETIAERQGATYLYYAVYDQKKPSSWSSSDEKDDYLKLVLKLVEEVEKNHSGFTKLLLTNKSISEKVGFGNLYNIFNARFLDVKEEIEKELSRLQLIDLAELCDAYTGDEKDYNFIITKIKNSGFVLKSLKDKVKIKDQFEQLLTSNFSLSDALQFSFDSNLMKKSERYLAYIERKDQFLKDIEEDSEYQDFKNQYLQGANTFTKMSKIVADISNEEFEEKKSIYKKEQYFLDLFSDSVKFSEIICYLNYLNEKTDYITMHKTKGTGIDNVLLVLDEFFWSKYNFSTLLIGDGIEDEKTLRNLKLFYVSCSRAINNLICIRLITSEELKYIEPLFDHTECVELPI